jgi:MFS family permease
MVSAGAGSLIGWAFDLFDLFILLFIAGTVGQVLFPVHSPTLSLASVYASFAVSLLMRPLGGGIFGRLADRRGRRSTMIVTVSGVGLATALMGVVPTYATAGAAGPVLFVLLRLVQGLLVGGVVASSHTLGTETVPARYRGLVSGLVGGGGAGLGALVASVLLLVVSAAFPGPEFLVWGWRVMFFAALPAAGIALVVFSRLQESPMWAREPAEPTTPPGTTPAGTPPALVGFRALLTPAYRPVVLTSLLVVFGGAAQYYLTSGYLPTFLEKINGLDGTWRGVVLIWASLAILPACVLAGHLSERFGRRPVMIVTGAVNVVALPLLVWLLASLPADATTAIVVVAVVLAMLSNAAYAPVVIFLNERFPTRIRATGTALTWNIGFALGGMTTTLVSVASPTVADIPSRLMWFLGAVAVVFVIGAVVCPETRGALDRPGAAGAPATPDTAGAVPTPKERQP